MKRPVLLLTCIFLLSMLSQGECGSKARQMINLDVPEESSLTVSGNPPLLAVTLDDKGFGSATDSSTTYKVSSNADEDRLKIVGGITTGGDMPNKTTLTISLSSQEGKSRGAKKLSTKSSNLVTKLKPPFEDTGDITYVFNVSNWKDSAQSLSRVVTLTLVSVD